MGAEAAPTRERKRILLVDDIELNRVPKIARAPKIAALSSRTGGSERDRSREAGMATHLARPIAPRELLRAVERLFADSEPTEAPVFRQDIQDEIVDRLGLVRTQGFLAILLGHCEAALREVSNNGSDLDRMAHDLASTAGMLGYEHLSHCCRDVLVATDAAVRTRALPPLSEALVQTAMILSRQLDTVGLAERAA